MTGNVPAAPVARRADVGDLDGVVATLVASHCDYVWERWALSARAGEVPTLLDSLYRMDVSLLGLPFGQVWTTGGHEAVAMWLPAGAYSQLQDAAREEMDRVAVDCFGSRLDEIDRIDREVARLRPMSDWHLATMGTHPSQQRRGLGTAVLLPMLAHLDQHGQTATLETSEPTNLHFYGRIGFEVVGEVPAQGGAPPVWVMRR